MNPTDPIAEGKAHFNKNSVKSHTKNFDTARHQ